MLVLAGVGVGGSLLAASPAVADHQLACPSTGQCTEVNSAGQEFTFDPRTSGSLPAPITLDSDEAPYSISCPSAGQCTAVDNAGNEVTFNPSSPGTPAPITVDSADQNELDGVACPSASQCTAVDDGGKEVTFNPGSPGSPAPTTLETSYGLVAVACPSMSQCTALDGNGAELTFNPGSPGSPTPITVDSANPTDLTSVACPSASQCTGIDFDGNEVTFNPRSPGTPALVPILTATPSLGGVACPSVSQCIAVDGSGREVTFNPDSPGSPTPTTIDTSYGLLAVACPAVNQCTAVDQAARALTFNPESPTGRSPGSPGKPPGTAKAGGWTISHGSLSGIAHRNPKLAFTLTAPNNDAGFKTITVSLPKGLAFSSTPETLRHGISLTNTAGKKLEFGATIKARALRITLNRTATNAKVTITAPAITATNKLVKGVKTAKVKTLRVLITATGADHSTTRISTTLNPS